MVFLYRFSTRDCSHIHHRGEMVEASTLNTIWTKSGKSIPAFEIGKIMYNCRTGEYYAYLIDNNEREFFQKLCIVLSRNIQICENNIDTFKEKFFKIRRKLGFTEFDVGESNEY